MIKLKLLRIEEEAAACRKAFKDVKAGVFVVHCHHDVLGESLIEKAERRIAYILNNKPQQEQALRLRLFRPVFKEILVSLGDEIKKAGTRRQKAYTECRKANTEQEKADVKREKADVKREKADTRLQKANTVRERVEAKREKEKVYAEWRKADTEWFKAYQKWKKAEARQTKADAELSALIHPHICKDCSWDGKTIFSM